jgi:uncharacterized protein
MLDVSTSIDERTGRRDRLRKVGAALCAVIAGIYVLIGLGLVTVAEPVEAAESAPDMAVFGFGAASIFAVGAVLLARFDRRGLWIGGAALQVLIIVMYVGVSADRSPSFEAWGLSLRAIQVALLAVLVTLAWQRVPEPSSGPRVVDPEVARRFLAGHRLAVVGASEAKDNFGGTIYRELRDHGYDVVAVNPSVSTVFGDATRPDLASVEGPLDGVVVMVRPERVDEVVDQAIGVGIRNVWLFRGVGGAGSVTESAIDRCERAGVTVVPGACPLMFLEPVAAVHRIHRGVRHLTGSMAK